MTRVQSQDRGSTTRAALTHAAREVFLDVGYEAASIAEIVALAQSSVGSLYHHFGGKSDLWLAVYRDHQHDLQRRVADTFADARVGDHDAFDLFLIGTRVYLDVCWEHRACVQLFSAGDHPPGYGQETRRQFEHWLSYNIEHLQSMPMPLSRTLVLTLTTLAQTAGREVARQDDREKARRVSDEFLVIMRRLYPA